MSVKLITNQASMNAQRRLGEVSSSLSKTFERLSSGLRIDRASDDAAGLAVASSLNVKGRVFSQGIRNLNDANSYFDIATSSGQELSSIVMRIQELAQQSSNGTITNTQRRALDLEAQALRQEFNRISQTATFNGQRVFSASTLSVSAGGSMMDLDLSDASLSIAADGTLNAPTTYTSGGFPWTIATADLNRDGNLDIIMTNQSASNRIFLGNGDGQFSAGVVYAGGGRDVTIADFNGDGILDMISPNGSDIRVHIGVGDGTFNSSVSYESGVGSPGAETITSGDYNEDGILDILALKGSYSSLYYGNSNGSFQAATTIAGITSAGATVRAFTADVNNDGNLDVIHANGAVLVSLGNGNGTFSAAQNTGGAFNVRRLDYGDVNGDGLLDIVATNESPGIFRILLATGGGAFAAGVNYSTGSAAHSAEIADMNGDGIGDIVVASRDDDAVYIHLNNGNGTFTAGVSYGAGDGPHFAGVADLNGDGAKDVIVASGLSNDMQIYLGNGGRSFNMTSFSLLTKDSAKDALDAMRSFGGRVTRALGVFGSHQSRINVAINNLSQARANYLSASSQILDADVATESAELVRKQILQSSAQAVLSQANQLPQLALRLLQGGF